MIREILIYPNRLLKKVSQEVDQHEMEGIKNLIFDLADTMYRNKGAGLAAPQIGSLKRVFVVDIDWSDSPRNLKMFINPVVISRKGRMWEEEGCLSFPGKKRIIDRPAEIKITYRDMKWQEQELIANGYLSKAIQHEIDHLNGILLTDSAVRI